MNITLNECGKSMRLHTRLPKTFYANAVNIAAYLINQGPLVPMEFRISEEVWSSKKVRFSHLKVFGCVFFFFFLMLISILMLVVNLMQSLKYVFLLLW